MTTEPKATATHDTPLPFDLRTVVMAVLRYRWILALWCIGSVASGAWLGLTFAPQTFKSEVVLKYEPPGAEIVGGVYEYPGISTHVGMVKVPQVLREMSEELKLDVRPDRLGYSIDVENPKDTKLLQITARWSEAATAQAIAELTAHRFMDRERTARVEALAELIINLRQRRGEIDRKLTANQSADPEELQAYQREVEDVLRRLDENSSLTERAEGEIADFKAQLALLEQKYEEEELAAEIDSSNGTSIPVLIHKLADLERRQQELVDQYRREQLDEMFEVSQQHTESEVLRGYRDPIALSSIRMQRNLATLGPESVPGTDVFRAQMQELSRQIEQAGTASTSTNPVLAKIKGDIIVKEAEVEGALKRLEGFRTSRAQLEQQLAGLQARRPTQVDNAEMLLVWFTEREEIEKKIARLQTLIDGDDPFKIVSRADLPSDPEKSYRKIGALAATLFLFAVGFGFVIVRETTYWRIRSRGDIRVRLGIEVLAEIPELNVDSEDSAFGEFSAAFVRRLARRLVGPSSSEPTRILVTSCAEDEGRTLVSWGLARSLALQGHRVAHVDAHVSTRSEDLERGLTDFLYETSSSLDEFLKSTDMPELQRLPRGSRAVAPDRLAHPRFAEALKTLEGDVDCIIIDGSPLRQHSENELLATQVDAVILVVETDRESFLTLRKAIERLALNGTPIVGIVLNRVDRRHLDKDWS